MGTEKGQPDEDLGDNLGTASEDIPVHDWQIAEITRRKQNLLQNPETVLTWSEVQRRIRERHRQ